MNKYSRDYGERVAQEYLDTASHVDVGRLSIVSAREYNYSNGMTGPDGLIKLDLAYGTVVSNGQELLDAFNGLVEGYDPEGLEQYVQRTSDTDAPLPALEPLHFVNLPRKDVMGRDRLEAVPEYMFRYRQLKPRAIGFVVQAAGGEVPPLEIGRHFAAVSISPELQPSNQAVKTDKKRHAILGIALAQQRLGIMIDYLR